MDFEMTCETLSRKIFQCGRSDDPLGSLSNTDHWSGLDSEDFSREHMCMAWAVLRRLKMEYLDSKNGREDLYELSDQIEEKILMATSNKEIIDSMLKIDEIVKKLNLSEHPHIEYGNTNDKKE